MHNDPAIAMPHGVLGDIVVDLQPCIGEEACESVSPLESAAERLGHPWKV
jgi:hypothetical protein